ncbi:oxidoreductase [Pseudomonas sp. Z1-14]|uniref:PDR/VanB family oxidoreductase n=1 Tax=Pseudomonas sp. Z1-14 TaxID=2817409 RepID=UPI003DA7B492
MKKRERQRLKVIRRFDSGGGIIRIRFVSEDSAGLVPFEAGAHLSIYLPDIEAWRQYSICSDPCELDFYEIAVLKDPKSRGGSVLVHATAVEGAVFDVEGPNNNFPLDESAECSMLFGGGIGITPMIAMAARLKELGKKFKLHYFSRSEENAAFVDDLRGAYEPENIFFHFGGREAAQKLDLFRDLPAPTTTTHCYICGPQGFIDWIITAVKQAGYPNGNIHREYFSADVTYSGNSFDVECANSGVTVTIGPDDTIARVLAKVGIKVDVMCEEGVCGTCMTNVIEGEIDHRDQFLTDEERREGALICVCCSRANSPKLVLDI